jgi:hypothetical protein
MLLHLKSPQPLLFSPPLLLQQRSLSLNLQLMLQLQLPLRFELARQVGLFSTLALLFC